MDHCLSKCLASEHSHIRAILPQHFADQFGWEEIVATVNQAYSRLSPEERPSCGIYFIYFIRAKLRAGGRHRLSGTALRITSPLSGHQTYFSVGPARILNA